MSERDPLTPEEAREVLRQGFQASSSPGRERLYNAGAKAAGCATVVYGLIALLLVLVLLVFLYVVAKIALA